MLIKRLLNALVEPKIMTLPGLVTALTTVSSSGQAVTAETSKNVATAYRCINILSDDLAKMPLQTFMSRSPGQIERLRPNARLQNTPWLLEVTPNRWMTPFIFKKTLMTWLLTYGAAYAWLPRRQPGARREMFILPTTSVQAYLDANGDLWYHVSFTSGVPEWIPDVEMFSIVINSTNGITGRGVITYARESLGRQMGAHETQAKFYAQGLNPGGLMWMAGELDREARAKVRSAYEEAMSGSSNAYRLAILDNKTTKFEQITMKPVDAQFLESINANDLEIANFFGVPSYKLNQGKQSYQSNEQQNLDYLNTTLDPYLVQWEQAGALKFLSELEQNDTYLRFNRDVLLRTDATTRAGYLEKKILSGQLTPNEARAIDDQSAYTGGDQHYIPANMTVIGGPNGT